MEPKVWEGWVEVGSPEGGQIDVCDEVGNDGRQSGGRIAVDGERLPGELCGDQSAIAIPLIRRCR